MVFISVDFPRVRGIYTTVIAKMIEDCLVHYKIIKDDNFKIVQKISITSTLGNDDEVELIIRELNYAK